MSTTEFPPSLARPAPSGAAARPARLEAARAALGRVSPEAWGAVALSVLFVLSSLVWLGLDTRPPDNDGTKHVLIAYGYRSAIESGDLLAPLTQFNAYPPLVHLVGAIGTWIAGQGVNQLIMTSNVVFAPMLALSCYGIGSLAFNRRAGLLAAAFALATPMVFSQFHNFMVDPPLTALVALTVWMLLASRRFERRGYAIATGVAAGLGMMTKSVFPVFLLGPVLVVLARGGWRQGRNILWAAVPLLVLALPWYLLHRKGVTGFTQGSLAEHKADAPLVWFDGHPYPKRWSVENFTWYGWNMVNNQLYLPLTLFFLTGTALAAWRWLRRRRPAGVIPELLVGGLVSYLVISLFVLDDPRYTLPALVYVAVLGTGWITQVRRPVLRYAAAGALAAVCAVNVLSQMTQVFDAPHRLALPHKSVSPIFERQFTLVSSAGYAEGAPDRGYRMEELLRRAHAAGARRMVIGGDLDGNFFRPDSIALFFSSTGMRWGADQNRLGPRDLFVYRLQVQKGFPPPCAWLNDGTGIYLRRGRAKPTPADRLPLYCPLPGGPQPPSDPPMAAAGGPA